ncbi:uncharacterized protein PV07_08058 [Cladophialophora immunda]|uniref:Fe2OG dioxygenase domain-containing protein n=1 Tax=Cladophialophora immunda TaxID=569365 RepID=A0A0D2CDP8_9EURO|nr:uncharacterized protein PV07_08058 [Cladophialophora immunda]KIW28390.1 hypothetical protein PV07_08058 [Cladophialophora immunda]
MSTQTTVERASKRKPQGRAGVVNGKLYLSQGIVRDLAPAHGSGGQFDTIPIIDLAAMVSPDPEQRALEKLVADIKDACTRVGFFVIRNHGIDWKIVEDAFAAVEEFFGLPLEKKMAVHQSKSPSFMGYEEPYYTNVDRLKRGDLKESMTTAYDPWTDELGIGDGVPELLIRKNLWPSEEDAPKFRPAMEKYRNVCLSLMRKLIKILALAMGEEATYFDRKTTYPIAGIRALYYPPQTTPEDEETGLGAHTDVQLMTMIAQKPYNARSLQVLNANGEWIHPELEPQTFVVNLGDMVARLTNDTFVSTVHRVCNNGTDAVGRYSLPFFFGLSNDELVSTRPQFITEEAPLNPLYKNPITGYEHYNNRMRIAHHEHPTAEGKSSAALPYGMTKIDGELVPGM